LLRQAGDFYEGLVVLGHHVYHSNLVFLPEEGPRRIGSIERVDLRTGTARHLLSTRGGNGIAYSRRDGLLYVAAGVSERQIFRFDPKNPSNISVVADSFEGCFFNSPNDLAVDSLGQVIFSDPRYSGPHRFSMDLPNMDVYLTNPATGATKVLLIDTSKPNGVALSRDETRLLISANNNGDYRLPSRPQVVRGFNALLEYDYNATEASASNRRVLLEPQDYSLDGVEYDSKGAIYAASAEKGLVLLDAAGVHFVPMPSISTNLAIVKERRFNQSHDRVELVVSGVDVQALFAGLASGTLHLLEVLVQRPSV
jgi:sugar lactone lactonase YvrE